MAMFLYDSCISWWRNHWHRRGHWVSTMHGGSGRTSQEYHHVAKPSWRYPSCQSPWGQWSQVPRSLLPPVHFLCLLQGISMVSACNALAYKVTESMWALHWKKNCTYDRIQFLQISQTIWAGVRLNRPMRVLRKLERNSFCASAHVRQCVHASKIEQAYFACSKFQQTKLRSESVDIPPQTLRRLSRIICVYRESSTVVQCSNELKKYKPCLLQGKIIS